MFQSIGNGVEKIIEEKMQKTIKETSSAFLFVVVQTLVKDFNLDEEEVKKSIENINWGGVSVKEKGSPKKEKKEETDSEKPSPKKRGPKAKPKEEAHTCEGILQKTKEPCGKKATVEADGGWFCGVHAKSKKGDTKTVTKEKTKKVSNDKVAPLPTKKGTLADNQKKRKERLGALIDKVAPVAKPDIVKEGSYYIDKNTRIVFRGEPGKWEGGCGRLDPEVKGKVHPLSEADIGFLDRNGFQVCGIPRSFEAAQQSDSDSDTSESEEEEAPKKSEKSVKKIEKSSDIEEKKESVKKAIALEAKKSVGKKTPTKVVEKKEESSSETDSGEESDQEGEEDAKNEVEDEADVGFDV